VLSRRAIESNKQPNGARPTRVLVMNVMSFAAQSATGPLEQIDMRSLKS
jgi:hypothetical protein